jgi:hypothetical protein
VTAKVIASQYLIDHGLLMPAIIGLLFHSPFFMNPSTIFLPTLKEAVGLMEIAGESIDVSTSFNSSFGPA